MYLCYVAYASIQQKKSPLKLCIYMQVLSCIARHSMCNTVHFLAVLPCLLQVNC